jgi:uridylate kinase
MKNLPYRRILLKLSGETLMGDQNFGIDQNATQKIALAIKSLRDAEIDVAIVIGGGNIFRGIHLEKLGIARTPADQMGMLSTLINGIALRQALISVECKSKVMSALECPRIAEMYNWGEALKALNEGIVLIFVGGTGNPYFTTDTAAALRACEIQADVLLKATKVKGVYNKDPLKYSNAVKYDNLSYAQVLEDKLEVMDAASIVLCRDNHIPIFVFNMEHLQQNRIVKALSQKDMGTLIS